jgi:exopolysaccharide biosynthesis polyprenyl glycosylphosphotransferase
MYKRNTQDWIKHFDFFIIDEISLQISFMLAVLIRHNVWVYTVPLYRNLGYIFILVDALVLVLNNSMHNVIRRGYYVEVVKTFKHAFYVFAIMAIYMFATKSGDEYSRLILFLSFFIYVILSYGARILWKLYITRRNREKLNKRNMLVIATLETVEDILDRLSSDPLAEYKITGIVLTEDTDRKEIKGYPIVEKLEETSKYICSAWIDSVYIDAPLSDERVVKLMDDCSLMAIPTHYHIPKMSRSGEKRFLEKIGGTTVLTTSINYATPIQMAMKRFFDILGGLVGSVMAIIIIALVGPKIKKASPGPILFKQERIGKNGKRFKIYKIRSMYMDAEVRKKDLMSQNRVKDGMMFKLDFDPRIIGNEILPDGTQKTGIGEFIRRTSLDEFPQFFNVLLGHMSLVGTRPPTPDEWDKYEYHHRARLAIKPGITGMWQVSGRSEIIDFEEVVRLDTEYIINWSPSFDLKILFKTIKVILTRKGAM